MATRATKAADLAALLAKGPSLPSIGNGINKQELAELERSVKLWLDTWVSPLCADLIPELKPRSKN